MTDSDFEKLKNIEAPPPSKKAEQQALRAAMQAFEQAEDSAASKKAKKFQGIKSALRLIHSTNQTLWRLIMKKQMIAGTALAVVLAVAVTVTDTVIQKEGPVPKNVAQNNVDRAAPVPAPLAGPEMEELALPNDKASVAKVPQVKQNEKMQMQAGPVARSRTDSKVFHAVPSLPPPPAEADLALPQDLPESVVQAFKNGMPPNASVVIDTSRLAVGKTKQEMGANNAASYSIMPPHDHIPHQPYYKDVGRDQFENITPNPVKKVSEVPVSTFSVDVDTASYAFVRKSLNNGMLPHKDAVRVEELINYFDYDYSLPKSAEQPFKPTVAVYHTPWNENTKLLHIGIKGHDIVADEKPRSNLVFLLDVSGSMNSPDKLPLLKQAFRMLVDNLDEEDTVAIVTYAGRAGTVLTPTKVAEKATILNALDRLQPGGSTAGAAGIRQAYALAESSFDEEGVNRVILATDGDFNVGITNREELKGFIERKRKSGIFLSVLGFGKGNYNDALMQTLAQNGNGNAAYIDTLHEARKVLVDEASSTLFPIAKDVKIQIEFNPSAVSEYRLIGYETRILNREDFNNDKVDAGDIGAGHEVTAIYEITPAGNEAQRIDDLRYQKEATKSDAKADEYAFLKLRYKLPEEDTSKLIELPVTTKLEQRSIDKISDDMRFAASVAAFGQLLRGDSSMGEFTYDDVIALANTARGEDVFHYRGEFVKLVRLAQSARAM